MGFDMAAYQKHPDSSDDFIPQPTGVPWTSTRGTAPYVQACGFPVGSTVSRPFLLCPVPPAFAEAAEGLPPEEGRVEPTNAYMCGSPCATTDLHTWPDFFLITLKATSCIFKAISFLSNLSSSHQNSVWSV